VQKKKKREKKKKKLRMHVDAGEEPVSGLSSGHTLNQLRDPGKEGAAKARGKGEGKSSVHASARE